MIEARLNTNESREYLWNKINTPEKIIMIEGYKNAKIKKISELNYEIKTDKITLITFIPNKGVNQYREGILSWIEIIGDINCTIVHGCYGCKEKWLKKHFLKELTYIVE